MLDVVAAAELAGRLGADRFVVWATASAARWPSTPPSRSTSHAVGVVTLATQSAGCERADLLGDTPLLLVHGERDELLPTAVERDGAA